MPNPRTIRVLALIVVLEASTLSSCGPSRQPAVEIAKHEAVRPTELSADVGHERASLRWCTNRPDAPIQGYNIYLSRNEVLNTDDSAATIAQGVSPFNRGTYPGDTDPSTDYETFEATELADGVRYYAAVTVVYSGARESLPSNMIEFVCHPSGGFSLRQRYSGERDGFSFDRSDYVRSDDLDNQIYYAQIDGEDYLLSPSRLNDVLQSVEFHSLRIKSVSDSFDPPTGSGSDKIRIVVGDGCLLKTKAGKYAKIIVNGFSGSGEDREVNLQYSFMPVPEYTDF